MAETGRGIGENGEAGARVTDAHSADAPRAGGAPARVDHHAGTVEDPITLAESLVSAACWKPHHFGHDGPNPPYIHIGGKLWASLTAFEPCFASVWRDRWLVRTKVLMADHLDRYDQIMVEPAAFEYTLGPDAATEASFPFGAWLSIKRVTPGGIELWGKRQGDVLLPLEPLAVASAIWLRKGAPPEVHNLDGT